MGRSWNTTDSAVAVNPNNFKNSKKEKVTSHRDFGIKNVFLILGIGLIIVGIILFCMSYFNRYDKNQGSPMSVVVTVKNVVEQVDTEIYTNAEAKVTKYHLSGTYLLSGVEQNIVLNESYYSNQEATEFVGKTRSIAIDSIELSELIERPINYLICGVPICFGLILIILYMSCVILYRRKSGV